MPAFRPEGRLVREGAAALVAITRDVISSCLQCAGVERAGDSVRAVSSAADQCLEMHPSDRAVLVDAGFEFHQDGMGASMAIKNFLTRQTDLDGPVENERGLGHDDFMIKGVALSSKSSAVGSGDHTNVSGRHFQHLSESALGIMRGLGPRPAGQLSTLV